MGILDIETLVPLGIILTPVIFVIYKNVTRKRRQVPGIEQTEKESSKQLVIEATKKTKQISSLFIEPERIVEIEIDKEDLNSKDKKNLGKKITIFFPDEHGVSYALVSTAFGGHREILFERGPAHLHTKKAMLGYVWFCSSMQCEAAGYSFGSDVQDASKQNFRWFMATECYKRQQLEIVSRFS